MRLLIVHCTTRTALTRALKRGVGTLVRLAQEQHGIYSTKTLEVRLRDVPMSVSDGNAFIAMLDEFCGPLSRVFVLEQTRDDDYGMHDCKCSLTLCEQCRAVSRFA